MTTNPPPLLDTFGTYLAHLLTAETDRVLSKRPGRATTAPEVNP